MGHRCITALIGAALALTAACGVPGAAAPGAAPGPVGTEPDRGAATRTGVVESASVTAPASVTDPASGDRAPAHLAESDPPAPPPTTVTPLAAADRIGAAFLADLNRLRASVDLAPLQRLPSLDVTAQSWAETMAAESWLRHSAVIYDVIADGWFAAGENIGYGPDEPSIFAGLRDSPGHHANMANPAYTHVGLGVAVTDGIVWTVHLFAG